MSPGDDRSRPAGGGSEVVGGTGTSVAQAADEITLALLREARVLRRHRAHLSGPEVLALDALVGMLAEHAGGCDPGRWSR